MCVSTCSVTRIKTGSSPNQGSSCEQLWVQNLRWSGQHIIKSQTICDSMRFDVNKHVSINLRSNNFTYAQWMTVDGWHFDSKIPVPIEILYSQYGLLFAKNACIVLASLCLTEATLTYHFSHLPTASLEQGIKRRKHCESLVGLCKQHFG